MMAPPRHGPPIDNRSSSSSSTSSFLNPNSSAYPNYRAPSINPTWNMNPQSHPPPPRSVSSSSSSSYRPNPQGTSSFSSRFHPAHPLARASSIQPGIGSPFGPPALGGGLPMSMGGGMGMGFRSQSMRSASIAPSNLSRNSSRNPKELPRGDWQAMLGFIEDGQKEKQRELKAKQREKELRKERESKEVREESQTINVTLEVGGSERIEAEKEDLAETSTEQKQVPEETTAEEPRTEQPVEVQQPIEVEQEQVPVEAEQEEEKETSESFSLAKALLISKVDHSKSAQPEVQVESQKEKPSSQIQPSISTLPFQTSISSKKASKLTIIPSLSSWYLCCAPVHTIPEPILKSHPQASTLTSWVHLQGFRQGGEQHGLIWKSSALVSRMESNHEDGTYLSEALGQIELIENEKAEQLDKDQAERNVENGKTQEMRNLVSKIITASGKVYEVRGNCVEQEMLKRGFEKSFNLIQAQIKGKVDQQESDSNLQIWPSDEIWIDAVIEDLKSIEQKILEKKNEKRRIREMIKSKGLKEVENQNGGQELQQNGTSKEKTSKESEVAEASRHSKTSKRKGKSSSIVQESSDSVDQPQSQEDVNSKVGRMKPRTPESKGKARRTGEPLGLDEEDEEKKRSPKPLKNQRKGKEAFEHSFELVIPVFEKPNKDRSRKTTKRKKPEVEADRVDALEEVVMEETPIEEEADAEITSSEALAPAPLPAVLSKEMQLQNRHLQPEEQQDQVMEEESQPQVSIEQENEDVEMPALGDFPGMEEETPAMEPLESGTQEAPSPSELPVREASVPVTEEENGQSHLQTSNDTSSDEEVEGALFEEENASSLVQVSNRSVDADEFEAAPVALASSSQHKVGSRSRLPEQEPKSLKAASLPEPIRGRHSTGTSLKSSAASLSRKSRPRASAPSTSVCESRNGSSSLTRNVKVSREVAALTKSRFGTFNFLKPIDLVVMRKEEIIEDRDSQDQQEEDEEMNEIMKMEREAMKSSQDEPVAKSKGASKKNGKEMIRKSLPVTSRELHSSSSSGSDANSLDIAAVPTRSSNRTRVSSRPREWWKVDEKTFQSPLARSMSSRKVSSISSNGAQKRVRNDTKEQSEEEDATSSEDESTIKRPLKRSRGLRIATDSPRESNPSFDPLAIPNAKVEGVAKPDARKSQTPTKGKNAVDRGLMTYGRKGSRSPIKKSGSSSFALEREEVEDAYVFSD